MIVTVLLDMLASSILCAAIIAVGWHVSKAGHLQYGRTSCTGDDNSRDGPTVPTARWLVFLFIHLMANVVVLRFRENVCRKRMRASIVIATLGSFVAMSIIAQMRIAEKSTTMVDVPVTHGECIRDPYGYDELTKVGIAG